MKLIKSTLAIAALASCAALSQAQYTGGRILGASFKAIQLQDASAPLNENNPPKATKGLNPSDYVLSVNGAPITEKTLLVDGAHIKHKVTGKEYVVVAPSYQVTVGLFVASFNIAGPIQQANLGFKGGTTSTTNGLFTIDVPVRVPEHKGSLSIGGWYFPSIDGWRNDLYQAQLRYGLPDGNPWGLQLAYINNRTQDVPALTFHVVYTVSSAQFAPEMAPWSIEFGAGVFNSRGKQINETTNTSDSQTTYNTSFFVNGKWTLAGRLSGVGTLWIVRERNQDLTRFGLGVSYRF